MSRFALCLFASARHCEQKAADVHGHKMQMSAAIKALAPQRINEYNNSVLSGSDGY